MKKLALIFLLPLMAELVVACCNCMDSVMKLYTHQEMTIEHLDNSGAEPVLTLGSSIVKEAYGLRLSIRRTEYIACAPQYRGLFIQSAYAFSCSCPPPLQYDPLETITAISIISLNDFNDEHSAGTEVTGYFKVYNRYTFTPISDFLANHSWEIFDEDALIDHIDLLLMTAPSVTGQHQFKLVVTLSDNRTLEYTSTPVQLI